MTTDNRNLRDILSDTNVYMKCVPFENKEGGYFIGNCNMNIGLKNTVLRFIPPDENKEGAKIVILSEIHSNEEFEEFMAETDELDNLPAYFYGLCNMDITAMHTVFRFFPERFNDKNVMIIQQTQKREDSRKINNPMEVKIFMRCKELR